MTEDGVVIHKIPIRYEDLVFEDTHSYCTKPMKNGNPCPAHGNNWACPPYSPSYVQMEKKLKRYVKFLIIIYEYDLLVRKEQFREKHPQWDNRKLERIAFNSHLYNGKIYWGLRNLLKPFLKNSNMYILGNSSCRRCSGKGCAKKLGEPCRHPKERIYSMEASGINVDASLQNIGYKLLWDGRKKICQIGLICFTKQGLFQFQKDDTEEKFNEFYEKDILTRDFEITKRLLW